MRNFFFFKHVRELNEAGEYRHELKALPGQVTYDVTTRSLTAVVTERKVQCSVAMRQVVMHSPIDAVFGVKIEGRTPYAASLKTYTRNDQRFYRVDELVKHEDFPPEMLSAYNTLIHTREPEIGFAEARQAQEPAPQPAQRAAQPQGDIPVTMLNLNAGASLMRSVMASDIAAELELQDRINLSRFFDRAAAGLVVFEYIKNGDGSRRRALGTRNPDIIHAYAQMQGSNEHARGDGSFDGVHVNYYDIERGDWRSFTAERLMSVDVLAFAPATDMAAVNRIAGAWGAAVA